MIAQCNSALVIKLPAIPCRQLVRWSDIIQHDMVYYAFLKETLKRVLTRTALFHCLRYGKEAQNESITLKSATILSQVCLIFLFLMSSLMPQPRFSSHWASSSLCDAARVTHSGCNPQVSCRASFRRLPSPVTRTPLLLIPLTSTA